MAKTRLNKNGYREFTDSGTLVHRWKAKKKYGQDWKENFEVHHIDGDKEHNENSNLVQLSREDHYSIHQYENKKNFLCTLIIVLAVGYFVALIFGVFVDSLSVGALNIMRWAVMLIFVLAIELKYNLIANTIRRPHEKMWREEEIKK